MFKKSFKTINFYLLTAVLLLLYAANFYAQDARASGGEDWNVFADQFLNSYFEFNPTFAVQNGRHEFDGRLPDWSAQGINRQVIWLRSEKRRALAFDRKKLDRERRFERDYLVAVIDGQLFWLDRARWQHKNPYFYSPALDPAVYLSREYAPLETRLRAYNAYARNIPRAAAQIQDNLKAPLPGGYVAFGIAAFGGLARFYENEVPAVFADVKDENLQREFRRANAEAVSAMKKLAAYFDSLKARANADFALGAKRFREMLWATERIKTPLDELEKAGRRDLQRNLRAMREACAAFAPGRAIADCIAQAQNRKPAGGAVAVAQGQLDELRRFVLEKDIVSIPSGEAVEVRETPAYARGNLAGIVSPGAFDRGLPSVYYISPPDPDWSEDERRAYVPGEANLLFITIHEVYPGHFVHTLQMNSLESKIRRVFVGFGFSEGWAHYAEEMMWEAGVQGKTAEMRIGQLLLALLRDVRLLAAINLHAGKWSVEQAAKMFRESAFQDAANARQQAVRGAFDPAYLMYTLGKLEILVLRQEWTRRHPGQKSLREFHDWLLSLGSPPLGLAREALLGER